MGFTKENAAERARLDLAKRLNIDADDVEIKSISDKEFSDMSLGTAAAGEFAAQMIAYGWIIKLAAKGKAYEYRADKYQIRLHNFNGENYVIV